MELTLKEVESILNVSRYQISRYATDARLERTRHGHYEAASIASLAHPFERYRHTEGDDIGESREVWLVRNVHWFRRALDKVVRGRKEPGFWRSQPVTPEMQKDMAAAVREYRARLIRMPEQYPEPYDQKSPTWPPPDPTDQWAWAFAEAIPAPSEAVTPSDPARAEAVNQNPAG